MDSAPSGDRSFSRPENLPIRGFSKLFDYLSSTFIITVLITYLLEVMTACCEFPAKFFTVRYSRTEYNGFNGLIKVFKSFLCSFIDDITDNSNPLFFHILFRPFACLS